MLYGVQGKRRASVLPVSAVKRLCQEVRALPWAGLPLRVNSCLLIKLTRRPVLLTCPPLVMGLWT